MTIDFLGVEISLRGTVVIDGIELPCEIQIEDFSRFSIIVTGERTTIAIHAEDGKYLDMVQEEAGKEWLATIHD